MPRPATTHELTANFPYMLKAAFGRGPAARASLAVLAGPNPGSAEGAEGTIASGDQLDGDAGARTRSGSYGGHVSQGDRCAAG